MKIFKPEDIRYVDPAPNLYARYIKLISDILRKVKRRN